MTSLCNDSRSVADSVAFVREHRAQLGAITQVTVALPTSRAEVFFTMVLRDDAAGQMLLAGRWSDDHDETRQALRRLVVEAGFADEAADAVLTHAVVRLRRRPDGATTLERATGPRGQFPARLPTGPARQALHAFASGHGIRMRELADVLSVPPALVDSAMSARWLDWDAADRLAIALRTHPHELWPEWFGPDVADVPPRPVADSVAAYRQGVLT